jgi:hypothetical protein
MARSWTSTKEKPGAGGTPAGLRIVSDKDKFHAESSPCGS